MRNWIRLFVVVGGLAIVGCGERVGPALDPTSAVEVLQIDPARLVSRLVEYAANTGGVVTVSGDVFLANYFCLTTFAKRCEDASKAQLAQWGADGGSVTDLAFAVTTAAARSPGSETAEAITDDEFVATACKAVLSRDPDEIGKKSNLALLS